MMYRDRHFVLVVIIVVQEITHVKKVSTRVFILSLQHLKSIFLSSLLGSGDCDEDGQCLMGSFVVHGDFWLNINFNVAHK